MAAEQNIGLGSGFLGSLNEQQETALIELKERIKDVESLVNHPDGDVYLLRFLRATMKKVTCFIEIHNSQTSHMDLVT